MHNNNFVAQKLHGFFSSAFKKIIRNSTTPTFQEVGGVTRPFIFCRWHNNFSWYRFNNHRIEIFLVPRGIFMPPKELWEAYSNRTVRPSVSPSVRPSVRPSRFRVRSISPIFFEVGIPNLVCGYILGWRSVAYHFRVTVTLTLTSDLVFRIIVSGAYLLYYLR